MKNLIPVIIKLLMEYSRLFKDSLWISIIRKILILNANIMIIKCDFLLNKKRGWSPLKDSLLQIQTNINYTIIVLIYLQKQITIKHL